MIEFFFDLMSPYAYLSSGRIQRLANEYGRTLICRPIDLPAAKIAAGNYGPANREQPAKINHL
ncbi:MAG: DsbA family protein, partial [Gammaproteobacteria bacterium]|nr:DsbA family protein [Gammaproteobacteria bacterium]